MTLFVFSSIFCTHHHRSNLVKVANYCISAMVRIRETEFIFKLTSVYSPTDYARKDAFFDELASQKPPAGVAWHVSGDLNQIYRARDKITETSIGVVSPASGMPYKLTNLKKSICRIEDSLGAMRKGTLPSANLIRFFATRNGTQPSTTTSCMLSHHR